jgi:tRNA(Ile2) C34 agmatinyltransferase TiaS
MEKQRSHPCKVHKGKPTKTKGKYKRFKCRKCGWYKYPSKFQQFVFDLKPDGRPREEKEYLKDYEQRTTSKR